MVNGARYEINHDGQIVQHESALCADQGKMIHDIFNQFGWSCEEINKTGPCRQLLLTDKNGEERNITAFSGAIRNESRNPYEKKIQLGSTVDPNSKDKTSTVILGIYVFKANDSYKDAIFVGYPIDETIRYQTNPSLRGVFVNRILIDAKNDGFVYDKEHNTVGFRSDFIFYYLKHFYDIHYNREITPQISETVEIDTTSPDEQKAKFKAWMSSQKKANGDLYSTNTIDSYISNMGLAYNEFEKYKNYNSVFQIQDAEELKEYTDYLFNEPGFDEFNDRDGNKACSCGLAKYDEFLKESIELPEIRFQTGLESKFYRNRILFGAPGTGKSFTLNKERKELLGEDNEVDYERVTFHPDYSYANFVGTYKPVPCKDSKGEDAITYEYVPGPFMRIYVEALKNGRTDDVKPFLLIVEEINRANVAAVFGDIFQLLDRGDDEVSEYPIQASEDIKKYLVKELGGNPEKYTKIKLPDNMFIWSTMNSADQGVFPMDTAFKRRWDFTYLGIDDSEKNLIGKTVVLGEGHTKHRIEWNKLRKAINKFLAKNKVNEDKQLGPYFIPKRIVIPANGNEIDREAFISTFKNKVIMYLFEDAAKQKRSTLFEGCLDNSNRYSEICKEFDIKGIGIFNSEIQNAADPTDLPLISENEESTVEENGE